MRASWGIPIFAAGIGLGCWIASYRSNAFQAASPAPSAKQSKLLENRPTRTPHERKWQGFGELVAKMQSEEQEEVLKTLDPHDRAAALESLLTQAGPNGLDLNLKEMVTKILAKWGMEDFDGAWEWTQSCKLEAMRTFAVRKLLEDMAGRDAKRALALYYKQLEISPRYESDVAEILIKASAGKSTDEFIDLLGRFHFSCSERSAIGTLRSAWGVEFAPDFDFRTAADTTVKLMQERGGEFPERFPNNFIKEWGKRDLPAATDWMMKYPILPFNDWDNLYEAAKEKLGTKEAGVWMAARLDLAGDQKQSMMEMLINFSSSDNIKAVAAAIPDTGKRARFLEDLIAASGGNYSANCTDTALWLMSSPAARLAALRKMPSSNDWRPDDDDLKHLGITREQFDEISPSADFQRE